MSPSNRESAPGPANHGATRSTEDRTAPPVERLALSPVEAAEALGVSRSSVDELIASRTIPFARVGRRVLIPADLLREWLNERAGEGGAR